jgi:hypothetical protein
VRSALLFCFPFFFFSLLSVCFSSFHFPSLPFLFFLLFSFPFLTFDIFLVASFRSFYYFASVLFCFSCYFFIDYSPFLRVLPLFPALLHFSLPRINNLIILVPTHTFTHALFKIYHCVFFLSLDTRI